MSLFQLILFIVAIVIFYIFFKKLFAGDYPKRGVDFEASLSEEQIGGISTPNKIFSKPKPNISRLDELLAIADESVSKGDFLEAKKALQSAVIVDSKNIGVLQRLGYLSLQDNELEEAKKYYEKILTIDKDNDSAYSSLANIYRKQNENDLAIEYHEKSISLDSSYAPNYFNYANTLYELGRNDEALANYKKALELDNALEDAKAMIDKLSSKES
ncbi:MAG: tetratricopeptide repeat protein [Sulfurovaceae bacterium]|nr:tetratricopeptide repeat protein [Sulfurovaceae bacterium]